MKSLAHHLSIAIALVCGIHGLALARSTAAPAGAAMPPTITLDSCSWNHPGVDPFMGDVVGAVDRYQDIPPDVRERLKARMARREYEDIVSIRRDRIEGRNEYGSTISDMHFGTHQICRKVTRSSWTPTMQERGLVYCESGQCILVPTVCRNVSRITRGPVGNGLPPAAPPMAQAAAPGPETPLDFPPTGYGVPPTEAGAPGGAAGPQIASAGAESPGALFFPGPGPAPLIIVPPVVNPVNPGPVVVPLVPVIPAVPEPQTWALMLGGLAALVFVGRRRVKA